MEPDSWYTIVQWGAGPTGHDARNPGFVIVFARSFRLSRYGDAQRDGVRKMEEAMKLYSSDGGMFIIAIIIWVFLCTGEPDVWDAVRAYLMSLQPVH